MCHFAAALAVGIVALLSCSAPCAAAETLNIKWSVHNNFRLINGEKEQKRYADDIYRYFSCATGEAKKLKVSCKFDWALQEGKRLPAASKNYPTVYDSARLAYPRGWYASKQRNVKLSVGTNGPFKSCIWTANGERLSGSIRDTIDIEVDVDAPALNTKVTCTTPAGKVLQSPVTPIAVKDVKIVAIGDSFMSGEGNPQVLRGNPNATTDAGRQQPAKWLEHRCHRSLFSSTAIAAAELAEANPHISVTYVNVACSGATIDEGLVSTYVGRVRADQAREIFKLYGLPPPRISPKKSLEPQVEQVREIICPTGPCVGPDYFFVLTGGNELGFGPLVSTLAEGCDADCYATIEKSIATNLSGLGDQFKKLKSEIDRLSPKSVVLLQYPNPMQTKGGTMCRDTFFANRGLVPGAAIAFGAGITTRASKFGQNKVLKPLNSKLHEFACAFGWRHVSSIEMISREKGYCAKGGWFNTIAESIAKQDSVPPILDDDDEGIFGGVPTGAMHPNIIGHYNMAAEIKYEFHRDGIMTLKSPPKVIPKHVCGAAPPDTIAASQKKSPH